MEMLFECALFNWILLKLASSFRIPPGKMSQPIHFLWHSTSWVFLFWLFFFTTDLMLPVSYWFPSVFNTVLYSVTCQIFESVLTALSASLPERTKTIFLGFITLSENYPELPVIDMNKNQRRRRRRGLLSVHSTLAAPFWAGNVVLHWLFPENKKWVLQRVGHGQLSPLSLPSAVTARSPRSCEGQHRYLWRSSFTVALGRAQPPQKWSNSAADL